MANMNDEFIHLTEYDTPRFKLFVPSNSYLLLPTMQEKNTVFAEDVVKRNAKIIPWLNVLKTSTANCKE